MGTESPKTSTGLEQNIAGLLCYVAWWVSGIIFLILEPNNKFVRFHAIQSIVVFGFFTIVFAIVGWIPFVNLIINPIVGVISFILWIILMVKASQGQMFKLPIAGNIAENQVKSMK